MGFSLFQDLFSYYCLHLGNLSKIAIAIHGGAGDLPHWGMTPEREVEFGNALRHCLETGYNILVKGGSALDAVEESVAALEDHPLFNAGRGSALNQKGEAELDASIMCGRTRSSGSVCALKGIKNPVRVARKVMDECDCVFLSGEGALDFAREKGFQLMDQNYFITQERYEHWLSSSGTSPVGEHGTAGAIALDQNGDLAAATSTGGLVNKRKGRVGDSPVIGAGTYASNETCAVSCSGTGEYILRNVTAHEISALMKYKEMRLDEACERMLLHTLNPFNGQFGIIAMDKLGNVKSVFNTKRFYRAWICSSGQREILIY